MSDFGGSGLDPSLRSTVANDFSVAGDARVESLNNQLSGLFSQRLGKTETLAMHFDTLADIGAEIQALLADIQAKQQDKADALAKDPPDTVAAARIQSEIDGLKGQIDQARSRQDDVNQKIRAVRSEIQGLDNQIGNKRIEISGAEQDRDTERATKRSQAENSLRQIQEAEERLARAASSNAELGKKVEHKVKLKDKVVVAQRTNVEIVSSDDSVKTNDQGRLNDQQMRVAWQDVSFQSLSTGQAIQLMTWSMNTMPELRQAAENKFVGTGPRNDGLLAP